MAGRRGVRVRHLPGRNWVRKQQPFMTPGRPGAGSQHCLGRALGQGTLGHSGSGPPPPPQRVSLVLIPGTPTPAHPQRGHPTGCGSSQLAQQGSRTSASRSHQTARPGYVRGAGGRIFRGWSWPNQSPESWETAGREMGQGHKHLSGNSWALGTCSQTALPSPHSTEMILPGSLSRSAVTGSGSSRMPSPTQGLAPHSGLRCGEDQGLVSNPRRGRAETEPPLTPSAPSTPDHCLLSVLRLENTWGSETVTPQRSTSAGGLRLPGDTRPLSPLLGHLG